MGKEKFYVSLKKMYKCESGCDNNKYNCPPRMSDGRHFTDYRPRCAVTYEIQPQVMSSFEGRMNLTGTAESIIAKNRENAIFQNSCAPCVEPSTMLPELDVQVCTDRICNFRPNDPNGLGVGRGYSEPFEQLPGPEEKQKFCDVKRYTDLNMYPWDGNFDGGYERLTMPSGGEAMRGGHY